MPQVVKYRLEIERHYVVTYYRCPGVRPVIKGLDTCYSATYMSQTRDQQRFTIQEVTAD